MYQKVLFALLSWQLFFASLVVCTWYPGKL
jgi:hypothetical protein